LKSGLSFSTLVRNSERVLNGSGRSYVKHDIGHTVELEVGGGPRFVVRIQRLEPLEHVNPMLGPLDLRGPRREVNVAIILSQESGAKSHEQETRSKRRILALTLYRGEGEKSGLCPPLTLALSRGERGRIDALHRTKSLYHIGPER
jgi:hypothetical protein